MMNLMAEVAGADPMISGNWLIAIIGTLATAAAGILGKIMGQKQGENSREVTLKKPVPNLNVTTNEEPEFVTTEELNGHLARIEGTFQEIKEALNNERGIARTANSTIHQRLDKVMEAQAESRGELKQISMNVQRLLTQTKPPR